MLSLTNFHNKKTLNIQLEHQSKILDAEHKHQKELSIIQHSLDKRTEVVLDFRKMLEESIGILNYFHTEKADFERRKMLKVQYINPFQDSKVRDNIQEAITIEDMNNIFDHALKQINPIEDKLKPLEISFNLLSVYLDNEED